MDYTPDIVQVVPHEDYTVSVYFCDGKIVLYRPDMSKGIFTKLQDRDFFIGRCMILNDTLEWDVTGDRDETKCIDIDPDVLYGLDAIEEKATA